MNLDRHSGLGFLSVSSPLHTSKIPEEQSTSLTLKVPLKRLDLHSNLAPRMGLQADLFWRDEAEKGRGEGDVGAPRVSQS